MERIKKKYINNIKGAIGETLIKELFIENEFVVYDYGVEHLVPSFSPRVGQKEFDENCRNSKVIKSLPDFVVAKNGKAEYVEVKYKSKGFVTLDEDYSFKNAFVINVKKDGIFMAKAEQIIKKKHKKIAAKDKYKRIADYNPFDLSKKSIIASEEVAKLYFID